MMCSSVRCISLAFFLFSFDMMSTHSVRTAILVMVVSAVASLQGQESHVEEQQVTFVPHWVQDAIFYQIFPERFANGDSSNDRPGVQPWGGMPTPRNFFGGDLQGILDHLDYISSLGANTLYLNPIFQSSSNHKYNTDDYLRIDSAFGNEAMFSKLVSECHARGIRVILDGVFNHTGTGFFAFKDIKENGAKSKYLGWYNVYSLPLAPPNKPNYEGWWGYGDLPKLMTHNPDVRDYIYKVTEHWLKLGIDGWRLDVPNEIPHPFWIEWRKYVKSLNPDAYIVGEIWDDARPWLQGDQFDAVMNYQFRKACLDFFVTRRTTAPAFDSALSRLRAEYPADVNRAMQNLLGSHDTERLLTLCGNDRTRMELAWLFQMTYVGAPMVYYGDEIGMTGGKDPGCRGTMIWDEKKQDTVLLECMKDLISLRKSYSSFRRGDFQTLLADFGTNVYAFQRKDKEGSCVVILNNSHEPQSAAIAAKGIDKRWKQVWPVSAIVTATNGTIRTTIPPMSGQVFIGEK